MHVTDHLSSVEVVTRMKESKDVTEFKRWQIIHLAQSKISAPKIAHTIATTAGTIRQYIHKYNHEGIKEYIPAKRGGRRFGLLSLEQEKKILTEHVSQATKGEIITTRYLKPIFEKEIGKPVSMDYLQDVMRRHGWRMIVPRPHHPQRNQDIQEEFKKKYSGHSKPTDREYTNKG